MPELPEVETVRRGLAPRLEGATISGVTLNRANLRFPFPTDFAARLSGQRIERVDRRAKYLLARLSGGAAWLTHLGMTGAFRFADGPVKPRTRYYEPRIDEKHDHLVMELHRPDGAPFTLIYSDARRFGFMDLLDDETESPHLRDLGPEPLSNAFNAGVLAAALRGRAAPVKAALLDQTVVAGLGNIYVSEALHRAGIRPEAKAGSLVTKAGRPTARLDDLVPAIRAVLEEAIIAGGSTLRDFRSAEGETGAFQHRFLVYDRAGEPCPRCGAPIVRIVQSGRSSYYCPRCQR